MDSIIEITKKTADLARLSLSEEELSAFSLDMDSICRFAENMSLADSVKECSEGATNVLRADLVEAQADTDALLTVAPRESLVDRCFTVPKAVD